MKIYLKFRGKIILGCLLFVVCCGLIIWQGIYFPKNSTSQEESIFLIEKGQGLKEISENLEKENLIKNRFFFKLYVFFNNKQNQLQVGGYSLNSSMNVPEITEKFISGEVAEIKITIPEGFTLKQIESKLTDLTNVPRMFLGILRVEDFKSEFEFLKGASAELNLEGFLFPDTYHFSYLIKEEEIIGKMLNNFGKKLSPDLREEITRQKKSIFEIVIMASLLEKEVRSFEDKKLVSGILWKRLENGIHLQVDATITYITEKKTTKVLKEDLQIDSPYNTYKYSGLPIGPICNPGLESIKAAIYPEASNFWYYLSKLDGETIFSRTLEEHNIAKAKYLR